MPRGYSEVKTVEQCDASALLNLINSCDCFLSFDVEYVREVKKISLCIYIYCIFLNICRVSIGPIHRCFSPSCKKVAVLCVG